MRGASLLGAASHQSGERAEILLRNVGWVAAYVYLADQIGCEVIFEHHVSPNLPIAA
jgi:hypothetical protein